MSAILGNDVISLGSDTNSGCDSKYCVYANTHLTRQRLIEVTIIVLLVVSDSTTYGDVMRLLVKENE